jgi:hypothetical protein
VTETKSTKSTPKAASTPRVPKAKPSVTREARYHYHQNRAAGTFVVRKNIDVNGKTVEIGLDKNEFDTRDEMNKAVSEWLNSSSHSYDKLASTKHCN